MNDNNPQKKPQDEQAGYDVNEDGVAVGEHVDDLVDETADDGAVGLVMDNVDVGFLGAAVSRHDARPLQLEVTPRRKGPGLPARQLRLLSSPMGWRECRL